MDEMRAKGLVLPGYACTSQIWGSIRTQMDAIYDMAWVDWPRELTPGFHSVSAFTDWLYPSARQMRYDFVIGHSMGGLVALELAQRHKVLRRKVVLIETFLLPPGPFFRSLFLNSARIEDVQPINDMLERERGFYSLELQETLKQGNLSLRICNLGTHFHAIYGDRGCDNPDHVVRELAWSQELRHWGDVAVIRNACHFPMIENAWMTTQLLLNILA